MTAKPLRASPNPANEPPSPSDVHDGALEYQRGRIREIRSLTNPLIKGLKSLYLKKKRSQYQLFLAEGVKLIKEALAHNWPINHLLISLNKKTDALYSDLIIKARAKGAEIIFVPNKILQNLSKKDNAQNAIASFKPRYIELGKLKAKKGQCYLVLDRIRDPGNLGTILRSCDCAGLNGLILVGDCTDIYSFEAVRASMGSLFACDFYFATESDFINWQQEQKIYAIGSALDANVDFRSLAYSKILNQQAIALLMGNEQKGLSDKLKQNCAELIRIPQKGSADSLNLSIAAALIIFEAQRHAL